MNSSAAGGLFLIAIGAGIAFLWYRGYFSNVIGKGTAGMASGSGGPTLNKISLSLKNVIGTSGTMRPQ